LFCTPGLLEKAIQDSVDERAFRYDDLEFTIAARTWSNIVSFGDFELYKREFEATQEYFQPMLVEANVIGNEMIKTINEKVRERESSEK
jgi:prephenate dehydrogenase (NADP+)